MSTLPSHILWTTDPSRKWNAHCWDWAVEKYHIALTKSRPCTDQVQPHPYMESTPHPSTALRFLHPPYLLLSESSTSIPTWMTKPNWKKKTTTQCEPGMAACAWNSSTQEAWSWVQGQSGLHVSWSKATKGKVERCIQFPDFNMLNHPCILSSDPSTLIFSLFLFISLCAFLHISCTRRAPCMMLNTAVWRALIV